MPIGTTFLKPWHTPIRWARCLVKELVSSRQKRHIIFSFGVAPFSNYIVIEFSWKNARWATWRRNSIQQDRSEKDKLKNPYEMATQSLSSKIANVNPEQRLTYSQQMTFQKWKTSLRLIKKLITTGCFWKLWQ